VRTLCCDACFRASVRIRPTASERRVQGDGSRLRAGSAIRYGQQGSFEGRHTDYTAGTAGQESTAVIPLACLWVTGFGKGRHSAAEPDRLQSVLTCRQPRGRARRLSAFRANRNSVFASALSRRSHYFVASPTCSADLRQELQILHSEAKKTVETASYQPELGPVALTASKLSHNCGTSRSYCGALREAR